MNGTARFTSAGRVPAKTKGFLFVVTGTSGSGIVEGVVGSDEVAVGEAAVLDAGRVEDTG